MIAFDQVIEMRGGVDPARDSQANQLQAGVDHFPRLRIRVGEHDRADLHGADAALQVERRGECLAGEFGLRNMGQQAACIQVDGVTAGRFQDGDAGFDQALPQESRLPGAVGQVGFIQSLPETNRHGFQVAPGQAAVGGETLAQDQLVADALEEGIIADSQEPADIDQGVLLGAHPGAIGHREDLPHDLRDAFPLAAFFALLDEIGIFSIAAGIDEEGDAVFTVDRRDSADVFQRDGLPAAGVVGDGDAAEGDLLHPGCLDKPGELFEIHVALEGMVRGGIEAFLDDQVLGDALPRADVALGGIEVHVGGDAVAGFHQQAGQDIFRPAPLVGGDEMLEPENALHRLRQAVIGACPGVGFIPAHDGRPLLLAHRAGTGIGHQVDIDILRAEGEEVIPGSEKRRLPGFAEG